MFYYIVKFERDYCKIQLTYNMAETYELQNHILYTATVLQQPLSFSIVKDCT